jgi:hypothetical protein
MDDFCEVHPFSVPTLTDLIFEAAAEDAVRDEIEAKSHINYFKGYCTELSTKTIVVEKNYTDRYYTEDHSEYYVRCFDDYEKTCRRLHFFDHAFSPEEFQALIQGAGTPLTKEILQNHYLGFAVIKPLPLTVVGRTCLRVYPSNGTRHYPIGRDYKVNLFGLSLECKDTLAFQEQDSVVAACATSALWSVFHGTGILFHHQIPSPAQITKLATKHVPVPNRTFPNSGLSTEMMATAISAVSLEPHLENISKLYWLKCTAYAYLRAKIPFILGAHLVDCTSNPATSVGKHAVAVTGYNLGGTDYDPPVDPAFGRFQLEATKIDKLYVHDDQVGPFSKVELDSNPFYVSTSTGQQQVDESLKTSFHPTGDTRAIPEILLIPLYHKIRIPFLRIYTTIAEFNQVFEMITASSLDPIEWDIFLSHSNDFKKEVFECVAAGPHRDHLLFNPAPRFIWRAIARLKGSPLFEFTFDATDIDQGNYFLDGILYDTSMTDFLKQIASIPAVKPIVQASKSKHLFKWLEDL